MVVRPLLFSSVLYDKLAHENDIPFANFQAINCFVLGMYVQLSYQWYSWRHTMISRENLCGEIDPSFLFTSGLWLQTQDNGSEKSKPR